MAKLGVVPKLRLGNKLLKADGKPGGIESTGPHLVKFLEEPQLIMGKNFEGKPRQEFKFIVEFNGQKYRWQFPLLDKQANPHYLLERTADIKVGETRVLEMMSRGAVKYIDIRKEGEDTKIPDEVSEDDEFSEDEATDELNRALAKENQNQ